MVILTDDQGWGDLSIHGNTNLATPHIDQLADEGATLEHFYVCQVCAPTRAEFLTGRYYPRTGVSGVSLGQGRMNPDETTIADLFKAGGYLSLDNYAFRAKEQHLMHGKGDAQWTEQMRMTFNPSHKHFNKKAQILMTLILIPKVIKIVITISIRMNLVVTVSSRIKKMM